MEGCTAASRLCSELIPESMWKRNVSGSDQKVLVIWIESHDCFAEFARRSKKPCDWFAVLRPERIRLRHGVGVRVSFACGHIRK